MKTIYCLGGAPQFRLPCVKYNFLKKERKNYFKNINILATKNEKESMIHQIYPAKKVKKNLLINSIIKSGINKFCNNLSESLSLKKSNIKINNNKNNNENTKIYKSLNIIHVNDENNPKNIKLSIDKSNFNIHTINTYSKKGNNNNKYFSNEDELNDISIKKKIKNRRNKKNITQTDLSIKLNNYNYPIPKNSDSLDLFQILISKHKKGEKVNKNLLSISDNNNNLLHNNSNKTINYNKNFISYSYNKNNIKKNLKKKNFKLNKAYQKIKIKKDNLESTIDNSNIKGLHLFTELRSIYSNNRKRRDAIIQHNELNIIYSENEDQFYRKYDAHRKNKFLNGLALTHLNCSPKIVLDNLNKKIDIIKNKVAMVKYISSKAFPRVLADITHSKKLFENGQKKKIYYTPYNEKLNKIKKEQKEKDYYFSIPVEIINDNLKNFEKN